jgi:glycerophosphoryl diester phosphodiesterase
MKFFLSRAFLIGFAFCGAQGCAVEFIGLKKNTPPPKLADLVAQARAAGLDGLDLDYRLPLDAAGVKLATEAKLQFYVWTVDVPAIAQQLVAAGVKGITTNRPQWLREQMQAAQIQ